MICGFSNRTLIGISNSLISGLSGASVPVKIGHFVEILAVACF